MKISVFAGDLTDAPAEALCTSSNPRLSLMMGTGGAIRERGGFEVLRACEQIVEEEFQRTGRRGLRVGTVHVTAPGRLPCKAIIHCVASDANHMSSAEIIRACVKNALAAADAARCRSIAMPVFATGHARFRFNDALTAMMEALRDASTAVEEVIIVVFVCDRTEDVERVIRERASKT
jgi:O-acetyl-ADP-ribose deacetylase (regulator of RNase III)